MTKVMGLPGPDRVIDSFTGEYRFLSNFYEGEPFYIRSAKCKTAEHCYQAAKTLEPMGQFVALESHTPNAAKNAGRVLPLRPDWEDVKLTVMRVVIAGKFAEGSELAAKLLATGDKYLIDGNDWGDKFWGCVREGGTWVGQNNLGLILMDRRAELGGVGRPARGWGVTDGD